MLIDLFSVVGAVESPSGASSSGACLPLSNILIFKVHCPLRDRSHFLASVLNFQHIINALAKIHYHTNVLSSTRRTQIFDQNFYLGIGCEDI
jgi:hypothetical protein